MVRPSLVPPALAAALLAAAPAAAEPPPAECLKGPGGQPMATGLGNADKKTESKGKVRLLAERMAFLDGVARLKTCLGPKAAQLTGWSLAEVRYFDSDPLVEVDVVASFEPAPRVVVLGSAVPNLDRGGEPNVKKLRLETQRAAQNVAGRNAKETLDVIFPEAEGGGLRSKVSGTLGACQPLDVAYWDDQAVTVKLACGGKPPPPVEAHPAPAVQTRPPAKN